MAFTDKLVNWGSKIKGLFKPQAEVGLSHLVESGQRTMQFSGKVFGKDNRILARVEYYTQRATAIGSDGRALGDTSIRSRMYIPTQGTILRNLGVNWVETTRSPYGSNVSAEVKTISGKNKMLNGTTQLRNYIQLMK